MINRVAFLLLALACFHSLPAYAQQERSEAAKLDFRKTHPCPANGTFKGPCPGYVIDHITPLACGGLDAPINMQWQTTEAAKAKDKWERDGCTTKRSHYNYAPQRQRGFSSSSQYQIGPRGGCYTIEPSGKKRYVDHRYCFRY